MSDVSKCGYCTSDLGLATVHCHCCGALYHVACFTNRNSTCVDCGTIAAQATQSPAAPPDGSTQHGRIAKIALGLAVTALLISSALLMTQVERSTNSIVFERLIPPGYDVASDLKGIDLTLEGRIKSEGTTETTNLYVANQTGAAITCYWLDFDGKRKNYGIVSPRTVRHQPTYVNHIWLLEDQNGRSLRIVQAVRGNCRVIVQ